MLSPSSTHSVQQYVSYLHQQMTDPRIVSSLQWGNTAGTEVSSIQFQAVQSLRLEVTLSRQFGRL
jgi:hypothetical protein